MKTKKGQALIEILFAIGVIALCLMGVTVAIVSAVRNSRFAKNSTLAAKYAQEGVEKAREARDRAATWDDFTDSFSGPKGLDADLSWNESCTEGNLSTFTRCVDFSNSGNKSTVTVTVSWTESGRPHEVEAVTFLTQWSE